METSGAIRQLNATFHGADKTQNKKDSKKVGQRNIIKLIMEIERTQ